MKDESPPAKDSKTEERSSSFDKKLDEMLDQLIHKASENFRPRDQKKKVWKQKSRGKNGLVNSALVAALQDAQGTEDALREVISAPEPSPDGSGTSSPKSESGQPLPTTPVIVDKMQTGEWMFQFPTLTAWRLASWIHLMLLVCWLMNFGLTKFFQNSTTPTPFQRMIFMSVHWQQYPMSSTSFLVSYSCLILIHLLTVLIMAVYWSLTGINLYSNKRWHRFTLTGLPEEAVDVFVDMRADVLALGKLKHSNPQNSRVLYQKQTFLWSKQIVLKPSLEIVAQIATSVNLSLSAEAALVWQRLEHYANHYQSTNVDRYDVYELQFSVQDSCLLAYGFWCWFTYERRHALFPRSQ